MARSIKEIKKGMTDEFMSSPVIRDAYDISGNKSFDEMFSIVSLENIIFGIVASSIFILESLMDLFRKEVDDRLTSSVVATLPWYHKVCLEYQHGDELLYDDMTGGYGYAESDLSKRIVKFASCRDRGGGLYILVAGVGDDGYPAALSNDVLTAFKSYLNQRKPAGILTEVYSYDPDNVQLVMTIQYNPQILNTDGSSISNGNFPVEDAVNNYFRDIGYGGILNRNKLIDAIQVTPGVVDVTISNILVKRADAADYMDFEGNNYPSVGGSFKAMNLRNTIAYEI